MTHFSIRSRATAAAAVGVALVLTLSACTDDVADTSTDTSTSTSAGDPTATPSAEASTTPLAPLDAFFATMYSDTDAAKAQQVQRQEGIAACMAAQGFEYKPVVDSSASGATASTEDPDLQWGTTEYAAQHGYGMVESAAADPTQGEPADPNEAAVTAMSEAEREAYRAALSGTGNPKEEYHWETAGCQGAVDHETLAATGMDEDQYAALEDEMTAMNTSIDSDPRVSAVNVTWAACMADAGYADLAVVADAQGSIIDQVNAIKQAAYSGVDESTLTPEKSAELDAAIRAELTTFAPVEISTAVADFTCRDTVQYTQTYQDVTVEYQQKFMDDHQAELDAWMESSLSVQE